MLLAALPTRPLFSMPSPSQASPTESPRRPAKVLVVDDDPVVLEATRVRLENAGYEVHTREAALGTSEWVASAQPDVILLDVLMPALSGNELGAILRRNSLTRSTAVIFHSTLPSGELEELVSNAGALGAIVKTSDDRRFVTEFGRLVNRHMTRRSLER
jgi:PleD family two-component response regulator